MFVLLSFFSTFPSSAWCSFFNSKPDYCTAKTDRRERFSCPILLQLTLNLSAVWVFLYPIISEICALRNTVLRSLLRMTLTLISELSKCFNSAQSFSSTVEYKVRTCYLFWVPVLWSECFWGGIVSIMTKRHTWRARCHYSTALHFSLLQLWFHFIATENYSHLSSLLLVPPLLSSSSSSSSSFFTAII